MTTTKQRRCVRCGVFLPAARDGDQCEECPGRCVRCGVFLPAARDGDQCEECPVIHCPTCGSWRPTSETDCVGCAALALRLSDVPWDERCRDCGKRAQPGKSRCAKCEPGHLEHSKYRRERRRRADLPPDLRQALLEALRSGHKLAGAAEELGTTQQRVWAAARVWDWWQTELDDALMEGRPGGIKHGTTTSYKHGCRCPECREAKNWGEPNPNP